MIRPIAALAFALLLSGCATKFAAGIEAANREITGTISNVKAMNDATAKIYVQAPCAMDVGAFYRVLTPGQQAAVSELCGGSGLGAGGLFISDNTIRPALQ